VSPTARIAIPEKEIVDFCRRYHILSFSVFGSVLRDDFGPDSDVDVLVEFDPEHVPGWAFFDMQDELETLFGRKVDLITKDSLGNPFRRHEILRTQHVIYERARS
jgi:predicted nucleotidyltransferase